VFHQLQVTPTTSYSTLSAERAFNNKEAPVAPGHLDPQDSEKGPLYRNHFFCYFPSLIHPLMKSIETVSYSNSACTPSLSILHPSIYTTATREHYDLPQSGFIQSRKPVHDCLPLCSDLSSYSGAEAGSIATSPSQKAPK
jgi:hypothetical protein